MNRLLILLGLLWIGVNAARGQNSIDLSKFSDGIHHWELFHEVDYDRYDSTDFVKIADNILAYQNPDGGWPKNIDILASVKMDDLLNQLSDRQKRSTLDNRNTFPQIEYLAKAYSRTGLEKYMEGSLRGINYILDNQLANGGWRGWDVDAITYNDEVMTGALDLLLDIEQQAPWYSWLPGAKRTQASEALTRGIQLTLECQITQNGNKTAWAQQHDHETLEPVWGRSYEPPAITAFESVPIVRFYMRIDNPSAEIIEAIEAAVEWFEDSKIYGIRIDSVPVTKNYTDYKLAYELVANKDSTAGPIWARYYHPKTNEPLFYRRDGQEVESFNKIDVERRWGYEWYGSWPYKLLRDDYSTWRKTIE